MEVNPLQAIFQYVKTTLASTRGRALNMEAIEHIKTMCQSISLEQVGITIPTKLKADQMKKNQFPIQFLDIWEDPSVTIAIFVLPPGASIPLHNHPGMSVISHLLYGSLHITSYDIVEKEDVPELPSHPGIPVRRRIQEEMPFPHTSVLLPNYCNLHEFTAGQEIGCAILDILTPSYSPTTGRDCTYYRHGTTIMHQGEEIHFLEIHDPPSTFSVVTVPYHGQPIRPC